MTDSLHRGLSLSRRDALFLGAATAAAAVSSPAHALTPPAIAPDSLILFQGDSITDAGRDRQQQVPNNAAGLGRGYPFVLAATVLADHPQLKLRMVNRGISGNKVPDLEARWQQDCLDLKPAVLSILIGVNDLWHKLNGKYDGTPEIYRDGYTALLKRTREALPNVLLVICEPFVLRCGAVNDSWFPEFETRRAIAEAVAKDAKAIWVPFQQKFNEAVAAGTEPGYWAADGVHPTPAGHALMAKTWRDAVSI
jgi:lysophospholipase L1-like esterase